MTQFLYMDTIEGNYIKEFTATLIKTGDDYVILDKTAFYPEGGGQPSDTGLIQWDKKASSVTHVAKKGIIKHTISGEIPPVGTCVHATIDWPTRYAHMRMHTAQHIISGVVFDIYKARTVGNQIRTDHSRIDFHPVNFSEKDLKNIEMQCNDIIANNLPVSIYQEERSSLEKRCDQERCNLDLLPRSINTLRIVEIQGFDVCPCAGTHVRNTSEISPIVIVKKESKGKDTARISYSLSSK